MESNQKMVWTKEETRNFIPFTNEEFMNEENNYYTPDISDIKIGYECEIFSYDCLTCPNPIKSWKKVTVDTEFFHEMVFPGKENIRTYYLTKEQIEAEGWKHIGENLLSCGRQDFTKTIIYENKERELELSLYNDKTITIILSELFSCDDGCGPEYLYQGSCPSINEFRFICKLLKIN